MLKKTVNKVKYWGQIFMLPIYWLSFLMPRNKKIWLFGSTFGRRFADNPRYMYLYVNQFEKENIRPVWISHNKDIIKLLNSNGYEAYYYKSLKGIWFCLRAKVYFFDNYSKDISFLCSGKALKINMWHGIPLKKIQADNIFDKIRHPENKWEAFKAFPRRLSDEKPSHYVLTTSEFLKPIFSSAFKTRHVLTSGYPRNDRLINDGPDNILTAIEKNTKELIEKKVKEINGKMVYYMPTFRDTETMFFDTVDENKLQEFLKENNIVFSLKLHPKSKLRKRFYDIQAENIVVIDADADPYVFLEMADVLITDYSSIYFDYLLTDKPVIFFDYDLKEYLSQSRQMYFDYESFTPGEKAESMAELFVAILNAIKNDEEYYKEYHEKREWVADKMFLEKTGFAGERLAKDIKKILGGSR